MVPDEFERLGRVWHRNLLSEDELVDWDQLLSGSSGSGQRLKVGDMPAGATAADGALARTMQQYGDDLVPVRIVGFDKSADKNWLLPWHQDRVIALEERVERPGFKNWTRKQGSWHCEPPIEVLKQMLFVRVHLDDCSESNGPMKIAPGSHNSGAVPSDEAKAVALAGPIETCTAKRGDLLVLKMLTLHASSVASEPKPRRVIRVDYVPRGC